MISKFTYFLLVAISIQGLSALENSTCKACHPKIYKEYQHSIHANSSIYRDILHNAIWNRHPAKSKNNYKCAKCHTPSDHDLISGKTKLNNNQIQQTEPISCQSCHQIESIQKHTKSNSNIYTDKKKYFYSADKKRKGQKVIFKEESSFFGMFNKTVGSPYHDIDYSNENYYNDGACMGCHSHKRGKDDFVICDLEVVQSDSKQSCISCHMPQTKGAVANQKHTTTHAFHGASIHNGTPAHLSDSIKLSLEKKEKGFDVKIKNLATHTLFVHALRLGQLRVSIERGEQNLILKPVNFHRIIGKDAKPTMPWLADKVLKDTTIKAHETRVSYYPVDLKKGDIVDIQLGYFVANPKMTKKLGIKDKKVTEFTLLSKKRIEIQ